MREKTFYDTHFFHLGAIEVKLYIHTEGWKLVDENYSFKKILLTLKCIHAPNGAKGGTGKVSPLLDVRDNDD